MYDSIVMEMEKNGVVDQGKKCYTVEDAANFPQVKEIIQGRTHLLMEITTSFLDNILENIQEVPFGIRWICKQIKKLTLVQHTHIQTYI